MHRLAQTRRAAIAAVLLHAGCHEPASPASTRVASPTASTRGRAETGDPKSIEKSGPAAVPSAGPPPDHHRDNFSTATWKEPPADVRAIVGAFETAAKAKDGGATVGSGVLLDERLSLVAARLAADPDPVPRLDVGVRRMLQEAGSLHHAFHVVRVTDGAATAEWARQAASTYAAIYAYGAPLAVGIGSDARRPGEHVVVLARHFVGMVGETPRAKARTVRVALGRTDTEITPRLILVTAAGLERIEATRTGSAWSFERKETFDGTFGTVLGYEAPRVATMDVWKAPVRQFGVLQFESPPALPGDDAASLDEAFAAMRRAWKRAPLRVDANEGAPCPEKVQTIAGVQTMMDQECFAWQSSGSDSERWAAARFIPLLYETVDDTRFQLMQLRREDALTSVRFGRVFEDLTVDQARVRLTALLARRFPGIKHDRKADAARTALAERWAAVAASAGDLEPIRVAAKTEGDKWAGDQKWYGRLVSNQDLDQIFAGVDPGAMPQSYTLGVARAAGRSGEPRYYAAVHLMLPGKR